VEFESRFGDFRRLKKKFDIFTRPFTVDVNEMPAVVRMELIDLQCDSELLDKFSRTSKLEFYSKLDEKQFPLIYQNAIEVIALFGSTYLCKQFFSIMNLQKSKLRSKMSLDHLEDTLRVAVARGLKPNIPSLVSKQRC